MTIHHMGESKHVSELFGHPQGVDTDCQKLNISTIVRTRCPLFHLCRTGAASTSPTIVKVNHGRDLFLRQEFRRRGQLRIDLVASNEMDVKVSHGIRHGSGGALAALSVW